MAGQKTCGAGLLNCGPRNAHFPAQADTELIRTKPLDESFAQRITIQPQEVRDPKDIEAAIAVMAQQRPDALIVLQDALTLQHKREIIDFNMQERLPGMFVAKDGWRAVV
jgi:hypothetical protein